MRTITACVLAVLILVLVSPAFAAGPICGDVGMRETSNGLGPQTLKWSSEPANTASRTVMVIARDGSTNIAEQAPPGRLSVRLPKGEYVWLVAFADSSGKIICATKAKSFTASGISGLGSPGPARDLSGDNSGSSSKAPTVIVKNYYVVVFFGASYSGRANERLADGVDDYDGSGVNLTGYVGMKIFGNNRPNVIIGSSLGDIIYGGDESCTTDVCNARGNLGDNINGGAGDDLIFGGHESCTGLICNLEGALGDTIDGGAGRDEIHGGNETCSSAYPACTTAGHLGDTITGGADDDTIFGGDENCDGHHCGSSGRVGDLIEGGSGNDEINGGNESCNASGNLGPQCDFYASIGDEIDGGPGDDKIDGGTETCYFSCFVAVDPLGDVIHMSAGTDTIVPDPNDNIVP